MTSQDIIRHNCLTSVILGGKCLELNKIYTASISRQNFTRFLGIELQSIAFIYLD